MLTFSSYNSIIHFCTPSRGSTYMRPIVAVSGCESEVDVATLRKNQIITFSEKGSSSRIVVKDPDKAEVRIALMSGSDIGGDTLILLGAQSRDDYDSRTSIAPHNVGKICQGLRYVLRTAN